MDYQNKSPEKLSNQKQTFLETISERVHRHLRDIKSEITDEDLRNVRIELEVTVQDITSFDIFHR